MFECKIIRWERPPNNVMNCNTDDGASKENPEPRLLAFCIRGHNRNLMVAKGFNIQDSTNLMEEARVMRENLSYSSGNGITNLTIETNSLVMVHVIEGD